MSVQARYFLGQRVQGKIVNQLDFGIFVEIEDGVEGLVHETDLTQGKEEQQWREIYSVGQDVFVEVRRIDSQERKISLVEVGNQEGNVEDFIAPNTASETTLSDIFGELTDKFDD